MIEGSEKAGASKTPKRHDVLRQDNDIVVVKVGGKWRKIVTEDLPAGVSYGD